MTDERAVLLANLLMEYGRECVGDGATFEEVSGWTVAMVVGDIVDTTPAYLEHELDAGLSELTNV